ncbi:MAG: ferritin family protein [Candidatus Omnitrophica bacterium]|nr:ferritin family protein [Candidatus Omnitrophota bacterium]
MVKKDELISAFDTSIKMEEEGRAFYIKAAGRSKNEFGKRVFEALADDETRHIAAIKKFCEVMAKKDETPELCVAMPRHKKINDRLIFGKSKHELLKRVKPSADELKAYEIAMGMENDGYDFYKKIEEGTKDPNAKELYKFLLSEEEAHFDLISSTYEYLKDPKSWFAKEEKPIVEG